MANTTSKSNGKKSNTKKATAKKKTTNTRNSSSTSAKKAAETRRQNAAERKRKAELAKKNEKIVKEVYLWIFVAVSLLLFLSNFGICGIVGNTLRGVMLGVFGSMGYVFPIILVIVVGLMAYNEANILVVSKITGFLLFFIDGTLLFHLIAYGSDNDKYLHYYKVGAANEFGGGFIGSVLGKTLHSLLGLTGAYIIAVVLLMISIVILTEKSIMSVIKKNGEKAYKSAKEEANNRREENNLIREQRRLEKKKQKAVGVNFKDTTIEPEAAESGKAEDKNQDVHEIHIEGIDEQPLKEMEQDPVTYTYEEMAGNKQIKIEGLDEPEPMAYEPEESYNSGEESLNDESVLNGEFVPKERIIISQSAKDAMKRKPYGMAQAASGTRGTSGTSGSSYANATAGQSDAVIDLEAENMQQSGVTAQTEVKKNSSEGKIIAPKKKKMSYKKPPYKLLADNPGSSNGTTKAVLMKTANKLKEVLTNFGVKVEVTNVSKGPSVTRYELQPEMGTKVSRITGLADDIKLNMAAADIRIEAPIPGKAAVGIEIPNDSRDTVYLKELLMSKELKEHKSKLAFPAGKDIAGRVVVADIAKMPHMLIAGTTGSGKSVFTNSILMSILYRTTPEEVRIIVIDPKVVEFQVYNKIPHLLYDVVTDPKKAAGILNWAVAEMTTRYKKFANIGARDISSYNAKVESGDYSEDEQVEKMPQILIIIDELADLMMVAAKEVEEAICRLAQLARAAGIHMVIATQRPSVDVITGLIKANIPSRVALTVASGTDSRTIIDMNGAEKLLGNGDMLFYPAGYVKPVRIQGAYVSEKEISDTVNYIKEHSGEAEYDDTIDAKLTTDQEAMANGGELDPYFAQAGRLCIEKQKGSTSMIQRQFKVGFNRAARIMEQLYDAGVVGQEESNKPRKVIMSIEAFEQMVNGGQ